MPLVKLQKDNAQSGWALWFITESEETLQAIGGVTMDDSISSYTKRVEWLAGRALVKELVEQCGLDFYGIKKNEFGKPALINHPHHISLSHSYPYVAAQIDLHLEVGIDLEQPKSKLLNIAPRILSSAELADAGEDILKHCVYWCAKEALYKSYGKRGLHFADHLLVKPFELARMGDLQGSIEINGFSRQLPLQYRIQPDYVLVCTKI
ncbi:MAG: 4'-phosphopantetheinyl transferase [Bacteroidetes bacterium OLB12]|nr:MAG: 4'-phosphopantetheinyl transferase [Bacteroidetes bacterium OLB12]